MVIARCVCLVCAIPTYSRHLHAIIEASTLYNLVYIWLYLYMVQISVYLFSIAWHHRAYISMFCTCLKWGLIANFQRIWMIIDSYRVLLGLYPQCNKFVNLHVFSKGIHPKCYFFSGVFRQIDLFNAAPACFGLSGYPLSWMFSPGYRSHWGSCSCPVSRRPPGGGWISARVHFWVNYPLVIQHNYWKWPFIVDLPIENSDFP